MVVGDQDVDYLLRLLVGTVGDQVDLVGAAVETVCRVVARIDGRTQVVAEGAQRGRGLGGDAAGCLDVQHDVDIVGRAHDAQAVVDGVQLGHQASDQGPPVGRQDSGDLDDVRPWVGPAAAGGGDVDDRAFDARMLTV